MYVDSIKRLQNRLSDLRQKQQRILDSIQDTPREKALTSNSKYHIIVGSFRNPTYLKSYQQYIQEKGFNPKILENAQGFKLISIESSNNWSSSVSTLKNIRNNIENNAWIYANYEGDSDVIESIPSSSTTSSSSATSSSSKSSSSTSQDTYSSSSGFSEGSENWDEILNSYEEYIDQYVKLYEKAQNAVIQKAL